MVPHRLQKESCGCLRMSKAASRNSMTFLSPKHYSQHFSVLPPMSWNSNHQLGLIFPFSDHSHLPTSGLDHLQQLSSSSLLPALILKNSNHGIKILLVSFTVTARLIYPPIHLSLYPTGSGSTYCVFVSPGWGGSIAGFSPFCLSEILSQKKWRMDRGRVGGKVGREGKR